MSVTPSDFLDSARVIASSGKDEMSQRNAVSRAYYAAYHRSCEIIPPIKREADNKVGMHRGYIDQLMEAEPSTKERTAAVKLSTMHSRRIKADYRLNEFFRQDSVAIQLSAATELFDLLDA